MNDGSYKFMLSNIKENTHEEEKETLDNWKRKENENKIIASEWRAKAIGKNFNQEPGLDELHKIKMFLKKNVPDNEIMKAFGINAETLVAIKNDKYDPIYGISLDNQSKIYKKFESLENRIEVLIRAINHIADIMFINKEERTDFKNSLRRSKKKSVKKIIKNEGSYDFSSEEE